MLQLDLEAFSPYKRGVTKASLSGSALKRAAEIWRQYHPQANKEHLQGLSSDAICCALAESEAARAVRVWSCGGHGGFTAHLL